MRKIIKRWNGKFLIEYTRFRMFMTNMIARGNWDPYDEEMKEKILFLIPYLEALL